MSEISDRICDDRVLFMRSYTFFALIGVLTLASILSPSKAMAKDCINKVWEPSRGAIQCANPLGYNVNPNEKLHYSFIYCVYKRRNELSAEYAYAFWEGPRDHRGRLVNNGPEAVVFITLDNGSVFEHRATRPEGIMWRPSLQNAKSISCSYE